MAYKTLITEKISISERFVSVLCCPACRGSIEIVDSSGASEGNLACTKCKATYIVRDGVPRLYLDDDEVIGRSDQSRFSQYLVDRKRLEALSKKVGKTNISHRPGIFYQRISVLAMAGWMFLAVADLLGIAAVVSGAGTGLWVFCSSAILVSMASFVADFSLYRKFLNERYKFQVHKLTELSRASKLSEYDIHSKENEERTSSDLVEDHGDPGDQPKAEVIGKKLDEHKAPGNYGLNVGCGGELHQLISRPFFDHGYEMVGVDIFEDYLTQYARLFNTNAAQANAMALPFRTGTFDVVNFCDILEHLHHPFLGVAELNRVLKNGGLAIVSTNYRCRLNRDCANPLILAERVVSLYYDRILGPRDMLRGFEGMEFYHLDFSRKEITELLESAGFEIIEFYTYLSKRKGLTRLFSALPVLRFLGDAILVTCRKKSI